MKANHNSSSRVYLRETAVAYEQRYNKWKQITTKNAKDIRNLKLLPMSKDTINESKSQPVSPISFAHIWLLPMSKDTINESKSQLVEGKTSGAKAVAYEQRYNKWKQITTLRISSLFRLRLLPMSKDTINESKSQPFCINEPPHERCCLWAKIQ